MRRILLVLAFAVSPACGIVDPAEPLEFSDAIAYFDEGLFPPLWRELTTCSRLSGNVRSVGFYFVNRETLPTSLPGIRTVGQYYPRSHRIFIVASETSNRNVIRHEMMHALLRDASGHPPKYFSAEGLCGYV